jgi:allantoicase
MPSELLRPELGTSMNDGWETARHPDRPPVVTRDANTGLQDTTLSDWSVIKLGLGGAVGGGGGDGGVDRIIVDTRHFKGNYPESVAIDGCYVDSEVVSSADERVCESASGKDGGSSSRGGGIEWFPLLRRTRLTAHAEHEYTGEYVVNSHMAVTHVRVSITPDGGLSRVRIYGHPAKDGTDPLVGGSKL